MFPSIYLPRLADLRRCAGLDPYPIWQRPFLVSFFGVRGIVSLAAALALPLTTATGMPFPHRDLILLLTFWVILIYAGRPGLVAAAGAGAGSASCKIAATEQKEERDAELAARRAAIDAVLPRLDQLARASATCRSSLVDALRSRHAARLNRAERRRFRGEASAS